MKRFINVTLWTIIFLIVSFICVLSIKKFFDKKQVNKVENILALNYTIDFVSFNKLENMESEIVEVETLTVEQNLVDEEKTEEIKTEVKTEIKEELIEEEIVEEDIKEEVEEIKKDEIISDIIFDGLTEDALVINLEKYLKNELSGTGVKFVDFYKNTGLDPYLAASIVLHETGCTWKCSSLVRECFNYGGMKGGENKYKETNYTCYSSKEEGINAYLNMLYNNYYSKGLTTPELINPKYAASLEWAAAINRYIDKFKNS